MSRANATDLTIPQPITLVSSHSTMLALWSEYTPPVSLITDKLNVDETDIGSTLLSNTWETRVLISRKQKACKPISLKRSVCKVTNKQIRFGWSLATRVASDECNTASDEWAAITHRREASKSLSQLAAKCTEKNGQTLWLNANIALGKLEFYLSERRLDKTEKIKNERKERGLLCVRYISSAPSN